MPLPTLSNACPRSYGSIGNGSTSQWQEALPTTRFHDVEDCHRSSRDNSTPLSFLSNQSSNRNSRVFGGVVASLAVCCVMVGLYNTSPSTAVAVNQGTSDRFTNMAKSGRYLVMTEEAAKKAAAAKPEEEKKASDAKPEKKKEGSEEKTAAKDKAEPAKEAASKEAAKPAEAQKKPQGEDRAAQSYEKAAKHHMAAATHYEKLAEDVEKKAARVEKEAEGEYNHAIKEAKAMEDQADATARAELRQVRANKKLLNSKWAAKFDDPKNWV